MTLYGARVLSPVGLRSISIAMSRRPPMWPSWGLGRRLVCYHTGIYATGRTSSCHLPGQWGSERTDDSQSLTFGVCGIYVAARRKVLPRVPQLSPSSR